MEEILFSVRITPQIIYLSLILVVIGKALRDTPIVDNWIIIWVLMFISIVINFIFHGITFKSLFESFIATSIATTIYQMYKQTKRGISTFHKI